MNYFLNVGATAWIYVVLAVSLNVVQGTAGILTIAQGGFMGVGAYATAILAANHGVSFLATVPIGMVACALLGYLLFIPTARIRGFLQVIITFAFMLVVSSVFVNLTQLTGGAYGIADIPAFSIAGWSATSNFDYFLAYGVIALLVTVGYRRLTASSYGVGLKAIRENELAARAAGLNVARHRRVIFMVGAALAGLSGSMYASFIGYIDPTPFTVYLSFLVVAMVVLGGSGSPLGTVIGACLLSVLPNIITLFNLPSSIGGALAEVIYGAAIVVVVRLRPEGLVPERPWRLLRQRVRALAPTRRDASVAMPAAVPDSAAG
jgi:branched-chain amino acid transport system permease protein